MFVHLGNNVVVNIKDIVTIIDIENTTTSKITRDFLTECQKKNIVENISEDLPKSAVVCKYKNEIKVYISQISPVTLQGRYNRRRIF